MRELLDGALAFLDGADEELALAHALEDVSALLLPEGLAGEHVLVSGREAELRDVTVVHDDLPLAVGTHLDGGVRRDDAVVVAGETAGRDGLELGEFGEGFADVVELDVEDARALLEATAHHGLPAVADEPGRGGQAPAALAELGEETLAEVAGADAGRVEGHQQRMGRHHGLVGLAGTQREGREVFLHEATFVERGDEELQRFLHGRVVAGRAGLVGEMLRERGFAGGRFEHVPAALFVFLGVALGTDLFVIALVPVLLHALQGVEIVVAEGKFAGPVVLRFLGGHRGVQALIGDRFDLLQQRVGRQFGGNLTQELGRRHLEDAERLAKLRRQDEALDLLLRLIDALVAHRARAMKKRSGPICKGY